MSSTRLKQGPQDAALERQTVRNRTNQRNFRSRRQAYIRDLEAQVQACQAAQMQATKEMQIAARAVAAENYLLRELLKSHLHRNDRDIDMLLVHMHGASPALRLEHRVKTGFNHTRADTTQSNLPSTSSDQIRSVRQEPSSHIAPRAADRNSVTKKTTTPPPPPPPPQPHNTSPRKSTLQSPFTGAPISQHDVELQANGNIYHHTSTWDSTNRDHGSPQRPTPTANIYPHNSAQCCTNAKNSISCEEAASIIAGLRLQHAEDVRAQLGCTSAVPCEIENVALLQMMTETI